LGHNQTVALQTASADFPDILAVRTDKDYFMAAIVDNPDSVSADFLWNQVDWMDEVSKSGNEAFTVGFYATGAGYPDYPRIAAVSG
jgi:hypothetical protein